MQNQTYTQSHAQNQAANQGQAQSHGQASQERQWYVQVDQKNYGPYDDNTLWAFMCEGRVNANSLVSRHPNTAYRAVSADPGLMNWIAQIPSTAPAAAQSQAQTQPQQAQSHAQTPIQAQNQTEAALSVFIVMAEIRSGRGMEFLQSLQGLGDVERIGDTVWILQARASSEDIRNVLGQPLGADDRLFILDSFANKTAWFNLGAQMDVRMQELWNIGR